MSADKALRSIKPLKDLEELVSAIQAGRVYRGPDGRYWRDIRDPFGSIGAHKRRCDVGVRHLIEQNRVIITEDGTVTVNDAA